MAYVSRQRYFFTTPKTESSNRKILIDDFLVGELTHWKNQQVENEKSIGDSYVYVYRNSDNKIIQQSKGLGEVAADRIFLVCTYPDGKMVRSNSMEIILKKAGINAHSFRHTHATTLIENGATPKGVAGRLGHSNAIITQNLYTHNTQKLQEDTVMIFEKTLQTNS